MSSPFSILLVYTVMNKLYEINLINYHRGKLVQRGPNPLSSHHLDSRFLVYMVSLYFSTKEIIFL